MIDSNTTTDKSLMGFAWALQRMAKMQGTRVDMLPFKGAEKRVSDSKNPLDALKEICKQMKWEQPRYLLLPDRAHLPLLTYTEAHQWALVVDRDPKGQWVLAKENGLIQVSEQDLKGRLVKINFSKGASLTWRLLKGRAEKITFFDHIRATLRIHKTELVEASVASMFIGVLALATSLFSMQIYDRVIPTRGEETLVVLAVGVMLTILIELAMKFARSNIMDHVVVGMDARLTREIFQRLMQVRVDQMPTTLGSLAGQMRGYEQLRNFYTASTLFALIDIPMAFCFIALVMWIATPWLGIVPAVAGLMVLVLGLTMRSQTKQHAKDGAAMANLKTGLLVEAVDGIETIKAGSGGWNFLSRWIDVNSSTIQNELKMRRTTEGVNYWIVSIQQLGYAGLVVAGALLVMSGEMTMGALIACSILSGRIMSPLMTLPNLMVQHAHAQAALEGIERLYELKADNDGIDQPLVPDHLEGQFKLEGVKFAHGDHPPALLVNKLQIQPLERIAVVGPIGAGKSTLLRMLSGLYHPQEGRILLDGLDMSHIQPQVLNEHIGYLQQDHRLFQGTLRENLLIGLPDPGDEAILKVMRRTGMDQFVAKHPKGLERPINEGGKGLSGGQKQLLAFTRLLLCNPTIYLLDEPTATMDDEQERKCIQVLQEEIQNKKTLVVVTHKTSVLALVDRIIVIAGNQMVMDGPREVVLNQIRQGGAQSKAHMGPATQTASSAVHTTPRVLA